MKEITYNIPAPNLKIYISIPITGKDMEEQFRKAEAMAKWIEQTDGCTAVSPFNTPFPPHRARGDERKQYAWYMGQDIEQLLLCDAIILCPGWEESKGCRAERAIAEIYGIRIIEGEETEQKPEEAPRGKLKLIPCPYRHESGGCIIKGGTDKRCTPYDCEPMIIKQYNIPR